MRYGQIRCMPDVQCGNEKTGETITKEWQYIQHARGTKMPDGTLIVWSNGGVLDVIEDRYMLRYWENGHSEWTRMTGSDSEQGETGMASCAQTPPGWPEDKRWLLAWSGSYRAEWGKAYRVWIGLATAPTPEGPWKCYPKAIVSQHLEPVPQPPNDWWPPGLWAVSVVCVGDRALVVGRDSGVHFPGQIPRHTVYEVMPDLTSQIVGGITVKDETAASWLHDVAISSTGFWHLLTGKGPHEAVQGQPVRELVTSTSWNGRGAVEVSPSGRVWPQTGTAMVFDPGWLRTPPGGLVEPVTVLANEGTTNGIVRGGWWLCWYTDETDVAQKLEHEPSPARVGKAIGTEAGYWGWPDMNVSLVTFGPTRIEWEQEVYEVPQRQEWQRVELPTLWPRYTSKEYRDAVARGEVYPLVSVRGQWYGAAIRTNEIVYPSSVNGRFL